MDNSAGLSYLLEISEKLYIYIYVYHTGYVCIHTYIHLYSYTHIYFYPRRKWCLSRKIHMIKATEPVYFPSVPPVPSLVDVSV
jgi:hypothetical protein